MFSILPVTFSFLLNDDNDDEPSLQRPASWAADGGVDGSRRRSGGVAALPEPPLSPSPQRPLPLPLRYARREAGGGGIVHSILVVERRPPGLGVVGQRWWRRRVGEEEVSVGGLSVVSIAGREAGGDSGTG